MKMSGYDDSCYPEFSSVDKTGLYEEVLTVSVELPSGYFEGSKVVVDATDVVENFEAPGYSGVVVGSSVVVDLSLSQEMK